MRPSDIPVPYRIEVADRAPKQRYYDPEFFALEAEHLWPRVWQMACRIEEIPDPGDFVEYTILDQSVIVIRGDDGVVRAFENTCRHRGVRIVEGGGNAPSGFTCPFHGWCYGQDGVNTHVPQKKLFSEHNLRSGDIDLVPVRCELWASCAWINLDRNAPPLRDCIEPAATILDAWHVDELHPEWWFACRLPVNWKLAQQAFQEQYHVVETHPQLVIPGMRYGAPDGSTDNRSFIKPELRYLRAMSNGMAGMVHKNDLKIAEGLGDIDLPEAKSEAVLAWHRALNDAVVEWHRARGSVVPDLNQLEAEGRNEPMGYVFPHWFVLPMYSSASSYRFRPLGPEETLMEIWSLTRFPEGETPPKLPAPEVWECDDSRWPPIPRQDFSNLPRQQRGLHAKGFEYMRLSEKGEGHLSNFERVLDGFLAGLPYEKLLPVLPEVNVNPLERPVVDIRF